MNVANYARGILSYNSNRHRDNQSEIEQSAYTSTTLLHKANFRLQQVTKMTLHFQYIPWQKI